MFLLWEWWRWVEMKVGFWIWDFHAFETELQMNMDLIGKRRKISVAISKGKDSHQINLLLLLSEIAAFRGERGGGGGMN